MAMRNPLYLDLGLLRNTADYHAVPYSVETEVIEKGTTTEGGGVKGGTSVLLAVPSTEQRAQRSRRPTNRPPTLSA